MLNVTTVSPVGSVRTVFDPGAAAYKPAAASGALIYAIPDPPDPPEDPPPPLEPPPAIDTTQLLLHPQLISNYI